MSLTHLTLIRDLLTACERIDLPLWLGSGWAVDARLGRITREHEDVDLAVPAERLDDFKRLLVERGAADFEQTDYGFLVHVGGVLLDCEPCHWDGAAYELEGTLPGSCPDEKQGVLAGLAVRCNSWPAILWEYFYYLDEIPYTEWSAKNKASYQLVREVVGEVETEALHARFRGMHSGAE